MVSSPGLQLANTERVYRVYASKLHQCFAEAVKCYTIDRKHLEKANLFFLTLRIRCLNLSRFQGCSLQVAI